MEALARLLRRLRAWPVARVLKRRAVGLLWEVRGRAIRNPDIPSEVRALLFVCKGNICRSPFAARLAARLLEASGRGGIRCHSAGIEPSGERVPPQDALESARTFDVTLTAHEAALLTDDLMAAHDVVVVMEPGQLEYLRQRWPEYRNRVFLLSLFGSAAFDMYERLHIADPYGKRSAAFDACFRRIHESVADLLSRLPPQRT